MTSGEVNPNSAGIDYEMWTHTKTQSQIVGAGLVMGVYGKELQRDAELIHRALHDQLSTDEIENLQGLRALGESERFGKNGTFGWTD